MNTHREAPRIRRGMSLIEVIIAMLILTGVLLVLGNFSAKFAQANGQAHLVITANEIATRRLDELRNQSTYDGLDTLKTLGAPDSVSMDNTKFARVTKVLRVGGVTAQDSVDYKVMTVIVTHPAMKRAISKSSAMAAF